MTKPSKKLPLVTLPSWGPCPASVFQAALGLGGSPKRCVQCLTGSLGIRSGRQPLLPQELPHLVQTLLIDDLPPRPDPDPLRPSESQGRKAGCP